MSIFQLILHMSGLLFLVSISVAILVLAFIELFSGGITTFILYIALHAIYGNTVITKHAVMLSEVVKTTRKP